ncbi:MAG: tyrosine-type recombinase/integrase [Patescibacteria group bacterium]
MPPAGGSRGARFRIPPHTLRHTFASQLAMKGAPIPVIQALLGHSSVSTTMRYSHVAPSSLRSAIEMLSPKTSVNSVLRQPDVNTFLAKSKSST